MTNSSNNPEKIIIKKRNKVGYKFYYNLKDMPTNHDVPVNAIASQSQCYFSNIYVILQYLLKGYSTFFWKYAHFTTPPELNC